MANRITRPKGTTRHHDIGRATGVTDAKVLAALALTHHLPERGHADSTDRMLDTVQAIIDGTGTGYEFNKVRDWIKLFPLRAFTAQVDPGWETWPVQRREDIALSVLMHGKSETMTAIEQNTTPQTVDAVVRAYQMKIKRLY